MTVLLALHAVVGLILFGSGGRLGRRGFAVAAVAPSVTLVWLATRLGRVLDGRPVHEHVSWVPKLGVGVDLRLDAMSALMVALVSGIGLLVLAYSGRYFSRDAEGLGRIAGLLTLFAGAMLCVVLADDLVVLYVGWELTSITSYLLIGDEHRSARARAAALHALLVTTAGGLAMLAGFVLIAQAGGTYRLSELVATPPSGTVVSVGLVLAAVGAFTKSAQYPFHSWLSGAMVAPTPVSTYLHSATMVKAGVFLVARLAPAFAAVGIWRPFVVGVGLATMVFGGLRALRQYDLKLLLAHGTVSQLGFLVAVFGLGLPEATAAGCVMLVAHALFKAALFMVVGVIDHECGTRDMRQLPPLGRDWWPVMATGALAAASMAGVPLLLGFIGKESVYDALVHADLTGSGAVLAVAVAGSMVTFAYSARFLWGAFARARQERRGHAPAARPAVAFILPAAVLAVASLAVGIVPGVLDRWIGPAAAALHPEVDAVHLRLWHGANTAWWLSLATLGVGGLLFVLRRRVSRVLATGRALPSGSDAYLSSLRGLNRVATRVTGVIQNGSLSIYAGVTLLTAAAVPGVVLLARGHWPGWPQWVGSAAELPIVVALLGAALAAAIVRRRFSAALFLGATGYAMAGLFVVQGAPDLALTQAAIETLSTVLFVLVLRRLPDRFERTSLPLRRAVRRFVAVAVGVVVFAFAIVSRGSRQVAPVSDEMVARSLPDGHGRNVVNVILVDMRGLDTAGEIMVLTAAAIGAVALARAGGKRRTRGRAAS